MESPIFSWIRMRLISRVHDGSPVHRVDAHQYTEEIGPLRNLKHSGLTGRPLSLNPEFTRSRKDLPGNQKRNYIRYQAVPRNRPAHDVVIVTSVAMAYEVGVILVEPDLALWSDLPVPPAYAFG